MVRKKILDKEGSMTIEMTIVFPIIMFIIIVFVYAILFLYQTANAQSVANKTAQHGTSAWNLVDRDMYIGKVYQEDFKDNDPYGRILSIGESDRIEKIKTYAYTILGQYNVLAKNNKDGKINKTKGAVEVEIANNIVTKKISVTIRQPTKIPIGGILKMFGVNQNTFAAKGYAEATINDPSEFIRNTDFTADMVKKTEKGKGIIEKVGEFKDKFYSFCSKAGFDFKPSDTPEESDPVD
ncbi:MAG: pilus assembly protein TadE [Clostridiales bacterium]